MAAPSTRSFYKDMNAIPAETGMCDFARHAAVPDDWWVAVVDIVGSTRAIEAGRYKDVNMISASAITAVLNAVDRAEVAYIFGGDGATLLLPPEILFETAAALYGTRRMAKESFDIDLRAGFVRVEELRRMNAPVCLAKTEVSPGVFLAALSGDGVMQAERLVKDPEAGKAHDIAALFSPAVLSTRPADFNGLGCRWQPLQSRNGVDISLIVLARGGDAGALYPQILARIADICGQPENWKPISDAQLKMWGGPQPLSGEARMRSTGRGALSRFGWLARILAETWFGKACIAFGLKAGSFDGRTYKRSMAANTDFIKFDNVLRLVMDVTQAQKDALVQYLDAQAAAGGIFYGLHAASSALMTCMVFDFAQHHFHFIDGADGGYALAAKAMKQQMKDAAQVKAA